MTLFLIFHAKWKPQKLEKEIIKKPHQLKTSFRLRVCVDYLQIIFDLLAMRAPGHKF